jgi:3-deoxy-D-manno-octulosonate 8-phosphate phosphatase (KDO 8-P phosphatase)
MSDDSAEVFPLKATDKVRLAAARVKVLILDVDGVLTDGGLYYAEDGRVQKRFNVQDGLGIKLAQAAGLEIAVITGLDSKSVAARLKDLGVVEYHAGFKEKWETVEGIMQRLGANAEELAFLGDDWVDAAPLRRVGLPMAVANAQPEVKALAAWVSTVPGGQGAVREAIRFILDAQGKLDALWRRWE